MKTYKLPHHITLHDLAHDFERARQTVRSWIEREGIPVVHVSQGEKIVCTMIPVKYIPQLRKINASTSRRQV